MSPELQELFSNHTKVDALLKTASKGYYKFQARTKAQNALVFLLGRISCHTGKEGPLKEQPTAKQKDISPRNCAAWGKHHRLLSISNLNKAFNKCLQLKHKQYCCYVCSGLVPINNKQHVVTSYWQHLASLDKEWLDLNSLVMLESATLQCWLSKVTFACLICLCLDPDFCCIKPWLTGTAMQNHKKATQGLLLQYRFGCLATFYRQAEVVGHLMPHFFDHCQMGTWLYVVSGRKMVFIAKEEI